MRILRKILMAAVILTAVSFYVEARPVVRPGIEVLVSRDFEGLRGRNVGILTNPSGVDSRFRSTIDIIHSVPDVNLVALFAPEHGVRGDAYAGDKIMGGADPSTGVPVYSVYGSTRMPTDDMLKGIDVVVYDIQDVGSRSYTFISSLGLMMYACAKNGIEVMVLDRPNPLGGNKVEGCYVEPGFFSFVSEFKIPYIYGLTVGELAMLINEEGLNCGERGNLEPLKCKLTVIPMEGWRRDMLYTDTGLPWVLPSPNIPYPQTAVSYPMAGLCGEFNNYLNIGIGYTLPFGVFGAQWIDADRLKAKLDAYGIPGIDFRTIHFKPFSGSSAGKLVHGVQYSVSDYDSACLTLTQFYVMQAVYELYPERNPFVVSTNRTRMFDQVCGTDYIRLQFSKNLLVDDISDYWNKDVEDFKALSAKYYLY